MLFNISSYYYLSISFNRTFLYWKQSLSSVWSFNSLYLLFCVVSKSLCLVYLKVWHYCMICFYLSILFANNYLDMCSSSFLFSSYVSIAFFPPVTTLAKSNIRENGTWELMLGRDWDLKCIKKKRRCNYTLWGTGVQGKAWAQQWRMERSQPTGCHCPYLLYLSLRLYDVLNFHVMWK